MVLPRRRFIGGVAAKRGALVNTQIDCLLKRMMGTMPTADDFKLDSRLEADSTPLMELPLSSLRLINDARYPWVLLVPRKAALTEIIDLDETERMRLMEEVARVSAALKKVTACDKLNIGALGNMVAQLHVHVIARFKSDAAWPGPVWGVGEPLAWEASRQKALMDALLRELA